MLERDSNLFIALRRRSRNRWDAIRFCSFFRFFPVEQVDPSEGQLYWRERPLTLTTLTVPEKERILK